LTRLVVGLGCAACLLLTAEWARCHHLEHSELELRPPKHGQLRGRFLLAPRAFSPVLPGGEDALTSELRTQVELIVGGARCITPFVPVEVWTEASPSPGHLVDLRCPVPVGVSAPRVDVMWRGGSDLLVTYPPTETTAEVHLRLAPHGQGSLLATEATPSPALASARPNGRPSQPNPAEHERPPETSPIGLGLLGLSLLWLLLAKLSRTLDARWARANTRRRSWIRAAALGTAAAGLVLFLARLVHS
jgi:hypothetical protein